MLGTSPAWRLRYRFLLACFAVGVLAMAACGRTGLEVDHVALIDSGPTSIEQGGSRGALDAGSGASSSGGTGGTPSAGGTGAHGGTFAVGGTGGGGPTICKPNQSPCVLSNECCSGVCHTEKIAVCAPPQCSLNGSACVLASDCCSKECADGICALPVCAPGASACTSCAATACCSDRKACETSAMCTEDYACAVSCIDQGKAFTSCWQTCVGPSLISNTLFGCITAQCPSCQ